jgi:putative membrane protein
MVMVRFSLSNADHDRISAAVSAAEAQTDGEIVTVIAPQSDAYHDVGLHYAVAGMLTLLALVAAFPGWFEAQAVTLFGGWQHDVPTWRLLTLLLGAQILVFLLIRYALAWMPLRLALTPPSTKARRVRRQAVTLFRAAAEGRTRASTAILLYLSLAEHRAEIVADSAINSAVAPERWGDAMAALIHAVRAGRTADGMVDAIGLLGAILAEQRPRGSTNPNELPDQLIEL